MKKLQDETGLDEDVNWSFYSELYDRRSCSKHPLSRRGPLLRRKSL
ncbi:MAG: hypothetical protein R2748_10185 [Bryobacterales bacterium]